MKTNLQRLFYCAAICFLFSSVNSFAQINYTENFDTDMGGWSDDFFEQTDVVPCNGAGAAVFNLWVLASEAEMVSPLLGVSNGGQLTVTYQYKLLNYSSTIPTEPTENAENWGVLQIYYATSPTGPWTLVQNVDPTNHIESASCATKTVSFFPPAGSNVYVGVYTGLANGDSDFFVYFDEFSAVQAAPVTCSGAPAASITNATVTSLCNTSSTTLSLGTQYTDLGITYQWQSSADGTNFTNVATGGTSATLTTTQTATTWYRAKISCGAEFTYSTPVQITSNGLECLCDITFETVEPITLVNFAGINNSSSAVVDGTPALQNFTSVTPAQVTQGQSYPITLKGNTAGDYENFFTVYFDWNHDGDLTDEGEEYLIGSIENSTGLDAIVATGTIEIPVTAMTGPTYMRVVKQYFEFAVSPCTSDDNSSFGQVEDYIVIVNGCTTQAPAADASQTLCAGAEVEELEAEGDNVLWYATETGGSALDPETTLSNGIYYASQIIEGCESSVRTAVTVTLNIVDAPEAQATQTFCNDATVDDLEADGDDIVWYIASTGGAPLSETTVLQSGSIYYAALVIDGCESQARTAVTAVINSTPAPTGNASQTFNTTITVQDIAITATGTVTWYATLDDAQEGENPLPLTHVVPVGTTTYYATQTINDCESEPFAVTVGVTLATHSFIRGTLQVYPNPAENILNITSENVMSTIQVYNMLGQVVLVKQVNAAESQLDISGLSAGTYSLKVSAGDANETILIIKK